MNEISWMSILTKDIPHRDPSPLPPCEDTKEGAVYDQKVDPQNSYQYLDFGLPGLQTGEKCFSLVYMLSSLWYIVTAIQMD